MRVPLPSGRKGEDLGEKCLPLRMKEGGSATAPNAAVAPTVEIHPFPSRDGLLVKILPPQQPSNPNLDHVPVDIVLCIDVSGSMNDDAKVPGEKESNGLCILDLAKHAARTILETLNQNDRLGIVTFTNWAKEVQKLMPMTAENKQKTERNIENLRPLGGTNLWHGIRDSLKLFDSSSGAKGRVSALVVLTDGQPNQGCPQKGYVPKLRDAGELPTTIHTFGFGYNLNSGLLKSIAEIGGGNYAFIPDAGLIGTVFVHAVANLQSTYSTRSVLRVAYPQYLKLEETTREAVDKQSPVQLGVRGSRQGGEDLEAPMELTITLNNLQYGQSRDIYLRYDTKVVEAIQSGFDFAAPPIVSAELEYWQQAMPSLLSSNKASTRKFRSTESMQHKVLAHSKNVLSEPTTSLPPAEIAYHISRSQIVAFLSSLYPPLGETEEHAPVDWSEDLSALLKDLLVNLPASVYAYTSAECQSLLDDLCGAAPKGQVTLALSNEEYYKGWGVHYLPSLAGAHSRQLCNSFKDPGPLMYGRESPLFKKCRERLDDAFDNLPAPKASATAAAVSVGWVPGHGAHTSVRGPILMSTYNRSDNPCFAADTLVQVQADGSGDEQEGVVRVPISKLRAGMQVRTPRGSRAVVAVLKTPVKGAIMCRVGDDVLVTPWHPISLPEKNGADWVFPSDVAKQFVWYTGSVYSVLLERDDADPEAHAIAVGSGGVWGVTLGHGLVDATDGETRDVRAHAFFGDYDKVVESLEGLHKTEEGGVVLGGGVTRNAETGLVDGFKWRAPERRVWHCRGGSRSGIEVPGLLSA